MLFEIRNRWSGAVQLTADIDCAEDEPTRVKIGMAVRWAYNSDAVLSDAVLSDAVLSDAEIPIIPNIDAAILASIEANKAAGTNGLAMSKWHGTNCNETNWCNTTHCRAGYAICVVGAAGFALEAKIGAGAAGALIYAKSRPDKPVPDFYCDDAKAMADIELCAAEQTAALSEPKHG